MPLVDAVLRALSFAFGMAWEITWALILGFLLSLKPSLVDQARRQADRGLRGSMEGHAEMDMSVTDGPLLQRITSPAGFTAISQYFVMDWAAIWKEIVVGLLIAGALAAWVPND